MSAVASNVRVPFLDLGPSHALVRDDILSDFGALIEANAFINGPHVVAFESAWAAHCGTRREPWLGRDHHGRSPDRGAGARRGPRGRHGGRRGRRNRHRLAARPISIRA
jgi:hypothetical protein